VIFELPPTKIILCYIVVYGAKILIIELLYSALAVYFYGRRVVLLYQPTYDEKQKVDYWRYLLTLMYFCLLKGYLKWHSFAVTVVFSML